MLVDHAESERVRGTRIRDGTRPPVDPDRARVDGMKTHQALYERALARAVLAEKSVKRAGLETRRHTVERLHGAEALAEVDGLDERRRLGVHGASPVDRELARGTDQPVAARRARDQQGERQRVR